MNAGGVLVIVADTRRDAFVLAKPHYKEGKRVVDYFKNKSSVIDAKWVEHVIIMDDEAAETK